MPISVQTNLGSMVAQDHLATSQRALGTSFSRLSSGYRINDASDDAAGLGISKELDAQVRSYGAAERNANSAISMAQTADGGADQIHNMLSRMRELAVQGADGSLAASDRGNLQTEFAAIQASIDRVANVTQFNGTPLLAGAPTAVSFQTGIGTTAADHMSVNFGGADATSLAVDPAAIDLSTPAKATAAITAIDTGIGALSTVREGFGAAMNSLADTVSNLQSTATNVAATLSRIRDVDVAMETASLAREQVLSQGGAAILGQANQVPQLALGLLKGQ